MGLLEIIIIAAVIAAAVTYVPAMISAATADNNANGTVGTFSSPRSAYGEPIPFIFGTVQQSSPICVYTEASIAYGIYSSYSHNGTVIELREFDDVEKVPQYYGTLDLLFCERIHKGTVPLGFVQFKNVYLGERPLYTAGLAISTSGTSKSLLDYYVIGTMNPPPSNRTGVYVDLQKIATSGTLTWYGGIDQKASADGTGGNLIGGLQAVYGVAASGVWSKLYGAEKVKVYFGSGAESANSVLGGKVGGTYPLYHKFVRLVFEDFYFGRQPQIEKITADVMVSCPAPEIGDSLGYMPNGLDVNPISVLYQLLVCEEFANGQKMPVVDTVSFSVARQTCLDEGLGFSYLMNGKEKLGETIDKILSHVDGILYREPTDGKLVIKLNRKVNVSTAPVFSEDTVIEVSNFAKTTWEGTFGRCQLTYMGRDSSPLGTDATNVVQVDDPGAQMQSNVVETLNEQITTAYDQAVAMKIATRKLTIANSPLIKMDLKMSRAPYNGALFEDLRPGDVFNFTYAPYGIYSVAMRVLSLDFGTLEDNSISASVIQDRFQPDPLVTIPGGSGGTFPTKPTATIATYDVITAPYSIASVDMPGIKNFSTGGVSGTYSYPISNGYNMDRFLLLAKRPYEEAESFSFKMMQNSEVLDTGVARYTPCGTVYSGGTSLAGGLNTFANHDYTAQAVPVSGLFESEVNEIVSSSDPDGRCIAYVDGEWIWVKAMIKSSTSLLLTDFTRMIWDSQGDPADNFRTKLQSGKPIWFLNMRNKKALADRLSILVASNTFIAYRAEFSDAANMDQEPYGAGFGLAGSLSTYDFELKNEDGGRFNEVASTSQSIQDRAARPYPIRARGGYGINTSAAGSFPVTHSIPSASTSFTLQLPFTTNNGVNYPKGATPRDYPLILGSITDENNVSEEDGAPFENFSETRIAPAQKGIENTYVRYSVIGDAGKQDVPVTVDSNGIVTISVAAEATTRTFVILVKRAYKLRASTVANASVGRSIVITLTRS